MGFLGELRLSAEVASLVTLADFTRGLTRRLHLTEAFSEALIGAVEHEATEILDVDRGKFEREIVLRAEETIDGALQLVLIEWLESALGTTAPTSLIRTIRRDLRNARLPETAIYRDAAADATQDLEAIQSVAYAMATAPNLDDLLALIVDRLVDAADAERGTLYLVDERRNQLYSKVLQDNAIAEIRVNIGEGLAGHVAQTGETLNIHHAYSDPRFNPTFDHLTLWRTRNMLVTPMRNPGGKIIGVVQVLNKIGGGVFTERDERLLVAMAAQAAISIETARLYQTEIEQKLLQQEIGTAKGIQESLLPASLPQRPGWDLAAVWSPARNVAGDFYDVQSLADGRYAFLIGDVSGKGVPAALFMTLCVAVTRFGFGLRLNAGELLNYTNQILISFNPHSRMFVTMQVAYVDFNTGDVTLSSAGHNPPVLYKRREGVVEVIKVPGVMAGMFEGIRYTEQTLHLAPGDVLTLYTDGVVEAMNPADEEYTLGRLQQVIQATGGPASHLASTITHTVNAHVGDREQFDDITMLIIRRV